MVYLKVKGMDRDNVDKCLPWFICRIDNFVSKLHVHKLAFALKLREYTACRSRQYVSSWTLMDTWRLPRQLGSKRITGIQAWQSKLGPCFWKPEIGVLNLDTLVNLKMLLSLTLIWNVKLTKTGCFMFCCWWVKNWSFSVFNRQFLGCYQTIFRWCIRVEKKYVWLSCVVCPWIWWLYLFCGVF